VLVRQVLGAIAQFEKASLVTKLASARKRMREDSGKCEGRKSHAELRPDLVVMRKGPHRFMVGHICGKNIYGEDFDAYTADFNAAVNRQDALRRKREIEQASKPLLAWLTDVAALPVFGHYSSVRERIDEHLPWLFDNMVVLAAMPSRGVQFPKTLFAQATYPEKEFQKVAADVNAAALALVAKSDSAANIDPIRRHFEALLRRIEMVLDKLKEVEDFFQPAVIDAVCLLANTYDNPKKRTYVAGVLSITCRRPKGDVTVSLPKSFKQPSRKPIEAFRSALGGLRLSADVIAGPADGAK
jgi:hypothetical protein